MQILEIDPFVKKPDCKKSLSAGKGATGHHRKPMLDLLDCLLGCAKVIRIPSVDDPMTTARDDVDALGKVVVSNDVESERRQDIIGIQKFDPVSARNPNPTVSGGRNSFPNRISQEKNSVAL